MKIEGKVHSTSTGYEGDMIRVSPEGNDVNDVPIGAKVTVEWDENEHRCEELEALGIKVQSGAAAKWAWWAGNDCGICLDSTAIRITHCPGCGVKLP